MENYWLETAKKLQAMAQSGLAYCTNQYDIERYEELRDISADMMSKYTDTEITMVKSLFCNETGYQTPKVDIRGVIFKDNKILMVREKLDGAWALPGGWADIGLTPGEVAVKEVKEEAGLEVKPIRLLAVFDKKCHPHPPSPYHVYKIFILCEIVGGSLRTGMETSDARFFGSHELPELSVERNTESQIKIMFEYLENPNKEAMLD
ncbi:MAG: ADP-ribose pyrophosphatase [Clostridia bacterium]|jgi:ADP-ribose pyrophosphatase YjhB (NUDIX family)|nr:ADP-ribose pyrophosphatase [Clostridia bacterium]